VVSLRALTGRVANRQSSHNADDNLPKLRRIA
jgi:hypothetical protein